MKKILRIIVIIFLYLLVIFGCPACAKISVPTVGGERATYSTFDPFRVRNTVVNYNPTSGVFSVSVTRENAVSPELINAAANAGAIAAAAVAKGAL